MDAGKHIAEMTDIETMQTNFRRQARTCGDYGSPLTAAILGRAADWLEAPHPIARRLAGWPGTGTEDAVALRFAGAVHAAALTGRAPALARMIDASAKGDKPDTASLWSAVLGAVDANLAFIDTFLDTPPQTNEVGRSAVLMAGALELASRCDLPIHLLEAGASAGLNLIFDHYRYHLGTLVTGSKDAPVELKPDWRGVAPPGANINIVAREACDMAPVDLGSEEAVLRLRSFVWAGQAARAHRLDAAIMSARKADVSVTQAAIGTWLEDVLAAPRPGKLTLLMHTIVWQYLPAYEAAIAEHLIRRAGEAATEGAPFARLAVEWNPAISAADVHLTTWPGGQRRLLGHAHAHGNWIEWLGWDNGSRSA